MKYLVSIEFRMVVTSKTLNFLILISNSLKCYKLLSFLKFNRILECSKNVLGAVTEIKNWYKHSRFLKLYQILNGSHKWKGLTQSKYNQNATKVQSKYNPNTIKIQVKCNQNTSEILPKCNKNKKYNWNTIQIQSKYTKYFLGVLI